MPWRVDRPRIHLVASPSTSGDDGLKIAQQMQAVVSALEKTKTLIVTDHIEHHLEELIGPLSGTVRSDLAKLDELAKYL
jgi:DNA-binding FrmR family transcriptional regulator